MDPALTAAAIGVGGTVIVGIAGFWANVRNTNKTTALTLRAIEVTEQGQVTDRYSKAIEQLGSDKLDVRIGGIYALERVARDSAADRATVMEVLATFIRDHSHEQWPQQATDAPEANPPEHATRPDVQAAVTVIGRRDTTGEQLKINLVRADLTGADLTNASLTNARLHGTILNAAVLTGADLTNTDLANADWPSEATVPQGWRRDAKSGRLMRADTNSDGAGN